ncbi:MAG: FIMAH domain-containing protein, partial [Planctomycetota bacterium]
SEGRSNALRSKLESAVASFDRGQSNAAVNQLEAFLRSLIAYVRGGHLPELLADQLLLAVDDVIDRV